MYHDTGNKEGITVVPALVLEYAEHGSLKSYQEAGYGRSLYEKLDIAFDTARGLEGLHEAGIVHGDVKPSNLLVFKHPTKKIVPVPSSARYLLFRLDAMDDYRRRSGLSQHFTRRR
ncbi:hypothetical protein LB505_010113 [Fusarium chuoi]|nr:hypothetical protein LB505_010113 [Fusarium chuoi]